ncbi:MAG: DMT family transporter [Litoreibacter sp.]|nr:DMT family transporter [Litoreibacter sp.]MCY4335627.1 DMT family transporter [Litoreibacter sp.]
MTSPSPQNPGALNWILIVSLGIIWGAAFMLTSLALDGFDFWTVAAARNLLGGLALWAVCIALGQPIRNIRSRKAWMAIVAIGLGALALPIAMLSWGLQYVPSAFAGVAMGGVPLLVLPLVAIFSPEEGIGPRRIIGLFLGFAGLAILLGPDAFAASGRDLETWGRLACLAAAACYACGSIITRRAPKTPPLPFATATLLVASLPLVPIALITEGLPQSYPVLPTSALILAALLPTALAAVIRVRVITTAGSLFMSLTSYQVPVWSVIFGIALMGEALPPQLYAALALILAGIAISQSRAWHARKTG